MTPREREKAFRAARTNILKLRTQIQRATASEITSLLKEARDHIRAILIGAPSEYQRWALPELQKQINLALEEFERAAVGYLNYCKQYNVQPHVTLFDAERNYPSDLSSYAESFFDFIYDNGIIDASFEVGNEFDQPSWIHPSPDMRGDTI